MEKYGEGSRNIFISYKLITHLQSHWNFTVKCNELVKRKGNDVYDNIK